MPGIGGLSIATNLLANIASLNLSDNQATMQRAVTQLSSGLRINSAADDPSGNSIAVNLQSQVSGTDQGSRNVQDANNAAAVASGALTTIKDILERIRQLAEEASSDITSDSDRASLQTETNQLLLEINRIAENTNFNGESLLDGSHEGYQPAQEASATITSNSTLNTASALTNGGDLVAAASVGDGPGSQEPQIDVALDTAAAGTGQPETVQISSAQYVQPGEVLTDGPAYITVDSVDPSAGTMTATFSAAVGAGTVMHGYVQAVSTNAVAAGEQVMTLASGLGDADVPLYAGEVLQVDPGGVNDIVKVQQVLSPTSFLADFGSAHAAGVPVYSFNGWEGIGSGTQTDNLSMGSDTDPPPAGSEAWVEESVSAFPASNDVQIVGTGTVLGNSTTDETIYIPNLPYLGYGDLTVMTALGNADGPVVPADDGTIELQVVNDDGTIGVQESYYDTATQTTQVAPYLISANQRGMYFDGVTITAGNVTSADVGLSAYVKVLQATAAITGTNNTALNVQDGPTQGDAVQLGIAAMNIQSLRLSNTNLSTTLGAEDAIGQVDYAIGQVLSQSAQLGAVMVRLNEDLDDNNTASVNLTSAAANITDLNVPQATTVYTKMQILGLIGASVLAQANTNAESILALFR
ncbi:MAG TPA: flagellin [Candidatus Acidoferrales bacterium]|nr:flagellin [Candidatus Acidoferrales bacterium]